MAVKQGHYPALDALRGVAALLVVFHHLAMSYREIVHPHGIAALIAKIFIYPGHPAVLLFFVLSGFVLQLSYGRAASNQYWHYVLRRFMRIFPALIASLILAAIVSRPSATDIYGAWLSGSSSGDLGFVSWLRNAALILIKLDDMRFNPVIWSLAYEWRISLVFPLLAVAAWRFPRTVAVLTLPIYLVANLSVQQLGVHAPYLEGHSLFGALMITLFYLPAFLMGMVLAVWVAKRPAAPARIPLWMEGAWLVAVAAPYFFVKEDFALALGATLLVALIVCGGRVGWLLARRPTLWLGKVSYSLYLVHFPLMLFFVSLYPALPLPAALAATLVSALVLSELFYRFVERPGIKLGKAIGSLARRRTPPSEAAPSLP
jgi:peptidoglycan/LPS O-acetylase OafA/YrhL